MTDGPRTGLLGGVERIIHCTGIIALLAALHGCGDDSRETAGSWTTATSVTAAGTTGEAGTGTSTGGTSSGADGSTGAATSGTSGEATTSSQTSEAQTSGGSSGGEEPQFFMLADPLIGGTMGAAVGGSFGDAGWTVTGKADRVYWSVPRLTEGSVAFTMTNVTLDNLPLNDHEVFAMYEGGYDIEHPIGYSPEFRNNAFKSMIRIYGQAEVGRTGQQKIMWGICPIGAPGYHDGECPCTDPVGFFEEPFGGDATWDGSPQRLKVEWKDGVTRYYRNDAEVLSIDWSGTGFVFGPADLYVSLGNPRAEAVDTAGMPIGAVFSDVVIEGWTGPATAICQQ